MRLDVRIACGEFLHVLLHIFYIPAEAFFRHRMSVLWMKTKTEKATITRLILLVPKITAFWAKPQVHVPPFR